MAAPQDYFQRIDLTDGNTTTDRAGDNVREDFMDAIYNIAPRLTEFMSRIGRGKSKDIYTSWQQDTLREPNENNKHKDGADFTTVALSKARRVGNINQISKGYLVTTGRADVVDKAGRSSEMNYQLAKEIPALKRDMEAILTSNQTAAPDSDGDTESTLGGLQASFRMPSTGQVRTAITAGTGSAETLRASTTTIPTAYIANGTPDALTETLLRTAIERQFTNGGMADTIMVAPAVKTLISTYLYTSSARVAALYSDVGQKSSKGGASAQGSVDVYISDFGAFKIIPNRFLGYDSDSAHAPDGSVLYILDFSLWATLYLRPFRTKKMGVTGDNDKRELLVDYTLQNKEEMGNAAIFDIDPTTPMVA